MDTAVAKVSKIEALALTTSLCDRDETRVT